MSNIQIFQSEQFGQIRTAVTESGEPLVAAADVARVLGYANPQKAIRAHCKGVNEMDTPTTNQHGAVVEQRMKFIPESDVYRLIMRSKLPTAEKFQDWACEEVFPALRKTGGYMVAKANETPEQLMARALMVAQETIKRNEKKLQEAETARDRLKDYSATLIERNEVTRQRLMAVQPKVLFADAVATSDRSVLVAELAKILKQNGVDIGQNRLFEWLRQNGYLCTKGEYYNQPTQRGMDKGLFELKKTSITKPDGSVLVTCTTKVTGKGQIYFVNKFISTPLVVE